MPGRILIIDDDAGFSRAMSRSLQRAGHDVSLCSSAEEARQHLPRSGSDVVVVDYQLPDADGLALLDELRALAPGAQLMMASAYPELDVAVEAMRRGAFDYVAKGIDARECLMRIERAVEVAMLRRRMAEASLPEQSTNPERHGLIGESEAIQALRARLDALSGSDDTTALILGETGTGKSLVARAIHAASGRAFEPLVAVDCTTIPVTLIESELFGHERGAFSGATASKQGRVEAAGRGTLFLDEIGELELPVQSKLLRLLEEREFTRVGSTRARKLEARIITATNRDLSRGVQEGRFRADLRYRLEVFVVEVPALRQRGDDILLLASHFAHERSRILGRALPQLHPELMRALLRYPFPGNVRELRNMVEQAVLLSGRDELTIDDFPVLGRAMGEAGWPAPEPAEPAPSRNGGTPPGPGLGYGGPGEPVSDIGAAQPARPMPSPAPVSPHSHPLDQPRGLSAIRAEHAARERQALVAALQASGGNISAAARQLQLSRHQLMRRLIKYGLR